MKWRERLLEIGPLEMDRDHLAITGQARLHGTLNIALIGAARPVAGTQFSMLTFASLWAGAADFETFNSLDLGNGVVLRRPNPVGQTAYVLTAANQN